MIELDRARQRIEPIGELLIDAHKAAIGQWRDLVKNHPHFVLPLDRTARANFLHCHLESEVGRRVESIDGVDVNDKLDFFALLMGRDILLRFKYVGSGGVPHNVPTGRQKLLARQTYDEDMVLALNGDLDIAPPTLLTCGYTLTDEAEVDRIEIRRECKGHLPWSYDLYGGEAVIEPILFDGMADDAKPARVTSLDEKRKRNSESETEKE